MIQKNNNMKENQRVKVMGTEGTIAYIGETEFGPGEWVGIILDKQRGNTNGIIKGISYFWCQENYGIFVRRHIITIIKNPKVMKPMVRENTAWVEDVPAILPPMIFEAKYEESDRNLSVVIPPPQGFANNTTEDLDISVDPDEGKFVEDLIPSTSSSTWTENFPIIPPPQELANDLTESLVVSNLKLSIPASSKFCFCCSIPDNSSSLEPTSLINSTPIKTNNDAESNIESDKISGNEADDQLTEKDDKNANRYSEIWNKKESNKLVESLPSIDPISAVKYWLDNNQVEGHDNRNEQFDTPVRTRKNYKIISQNEENTQEFFVTQEAEVKPRTEKTFDPGIIVYAKENLL